MEEATRKGLRKDEKAEHGTGDFFLCVDRGWAESHRDNEGNTYLVMIREMNETEMKFWFSISLRSAQVGN